jgi:RNA polymerase sigma factor (sigma-70 family)
MPISQTTYESIHIAWEQFLGGDKHALGNLAELVYPSLFHYGTKFTANHTIVEDAIQDLFLNFWAKRNTLRHVSSPKSYIFTSLRNNLIRKLQIEPAWQDLPDVELVKARELMVDQAQEEHQEWLSETMGKTMLLLPARQREALYLRYYENLSYEEIAGVMGLQRQAVANYIHEGISRLRKHWQQIIFFLGCFIFL